MNLIEGSKEIIERAIKEQDPYAVVLLLSGGTDSTTALNVTNELGIKINFILHGVTGTGIKETHDFVKATAARWPVKYIEANAGTAYVDYVLRKGFFGRGKDAHTFSYHMLKSGPFRKAVSKYIRQGKKNRPVLLINGARRMESDNRRKTMVDPIKKSEGNVWVNIINEWPDHACADYLEGNSIDINPVSKLICRSGECNCGTMLTPGDRIEIGYHFPVWLKWLDDLRAEVKKRGFPWDWADPVPKAWTLEKNGQLNMFQPMCSSCVINYGKTTK